MFRFAVTSKHSLIFLSLKFLSSPIVIYGQAVETLFRILVSDPLIGMVHIIMVQIIMLQFQCNP